MSVSMQQIGVQTRMADRNYTCRSWLIVNIERIARVVRRFGFLSMQRTAMLGRLLELKRFAGLLQAFLLFSQTPVCSFQAYAVILYITPPTS